MSDQITQLLHAAAKGSEAALGELMPLVYDELKRLAGQKLRQERPDHTLSPTALTHEAFLRLASGATVDWSSRAHFYRIAAATMRRILVDYARARSREKRGGGQVALPLSLVESILGEGRTDSMLDLDQALRRLEAQDERKAQVVELRFFGGLSVVETAQVLGHSPRTVEREWEFARAWLYHQLHGDPAL